MANDREEELNKCNPFLAGSQVYLRPLERTDLNEHYLAWLNDPEVTRYLETGVFPATQKIWRNSLKQSPVPGRR
jgi:hypothetical protein